VLSRPSAAEAALAVALGVELACLGLIAVRAAHRHSHLLPAAREALPGWMAGPIPVLGGRLSPEAFGALMVVMTVAYAVAVAAAGAVRARWPLALAGVAVAVATLAPPLLSGDVFGYIAWARMGVRGINPYSNPPVAVGNDPVLPFLQWRRTHGWTAYGPLFTLASYALAPLGLGAAFWVLKAAAGATAGACAAMLWRAAQRLGRAPVRAVLVFAMNPIVLVYAIAGAHNDLLMVALLLAGVVAVLHGHEARGAAGVVLAAAIKASAAVALPFMVAAATRPRRTIVAVAATAAAVGVASLAIFGTPVLRVASAFGAQQEIVAVHSFPAQLARLLGTDHVTSAERVVCALVLATTLVVLLVRVRRGTDWIAATGWLFVVLIVTTAWLLPWYVAWALPFAALAAGRSLVGATVALTLAIVMLRLPWLA
jgi:hypothetical protein